MYYIGAVCQVMTIPPKLAYISDRCPAFFYLRVGHMYVNDGIQMETPHNS